MTTSNEKSIQFLVSTRLERGLRYNAELNLWLETSQPSPHPVPLYIFKAPNGVWFQRPIFLRESGSSERLSGSSAPFSCGNPVPAKHCPVPAPHFLAGIRFDALSPEGWQTKGTLHRRSFARQARNRRPRRRESQYSGNFGARKVIT